MSFIPKHEGLSFIEQLHAHSVELCPCFNVPFITGIKDNKAILLRGSCKQWSCPVCGARNGRRWLARMLDHMNKSYGSGNWFFLTITAHQNARGAYKSRLNIQQGWKKLYNRMRRKYGISEYIKVWEFHEDLSFHLHLLIRRKIGKKWLSDNAAECGMGWKVDSSRSKNAGQCAGYISKYLIKSFDHADKYLKGMRRIEASRNWPKLPELASDIEQWKVHKSRKEQDNFMAHGANKKLEKIDKRPSEIQVDKLIRGDNKNDK